MRMRLLLFFLYGCVNVMQYSYIIIVARTSGINIYEISLHRVIGNDVINLERPYRVGNNLHL